MAENSKEKLSFQAEVSKLLDLVANSLYSEREIFLRELISNAADACEKLRYQSLSKKNLLKEEKDLKINIRVSKKKKIIEIEDNGIGMTKQDLIDNLGTIARSGTSKFIEAMKNKKRVIFLLLANLVLVFILLIWFQITLRFYQETQKMTKSTFGNQMAKKIIQ